MKVADRLALRESTWRELDQLLRRLDGRRPGSRRREPNRGIRLPETDEVVWLNAEGSPEPRQAASAEAAPDVARPGPLGTAEVIRLGELYRSACADLMLAEAHDMPRETVAYLHALVARAHNTIYRARGFDLRAWAGELFSEVPRRLRSDPMLRISALFFWAPFLFAAMMGAIEPEFAARVVGEAQVEMMEEMYSNPIGKGGTLQRSDAMMAGFYIFNNASIGLRCFAFGLLFGVGTLYTLLSNAIQIGVIFGHMATTPYSKNFYTFVTAHGPFELTAIVFSGAAGLRLGSGLIITKGQTRLASLQREAKAALPTVGAAVFLFVLAAFLEGFVSASSLPYAAKAGIALVSAAMLLAYLVFGGRQRTSEA